MFTPIIHAAQFLIDTVLTLFIVTVLLRFLLQWVRADFYNPVCQFVVKVTNPVLKPMRRVIPGFLGIDWAAIVLMLVLSFINQYALVFLSGLNWHNPLAVLLLAFGDLLSLTFYIYFFGLLILVLASWLAPHAHSPVMAILYQLINPGLNRVRRFVKPISGFDLSPLVFTIGLILVNMLVIGPIKSISYYLLMP